MAFLNVRMGIFRRSCLYEFVLGMGIPSKIATCVAVNQQSTELTIDAMVVVTMMTLPLLRRCCVIPH